MTDEAKPGRPLPTNFIINPWLLVVAALVLFGLTLNHWVTLNSLPLVAQLTGWDWHPLPLVWRSEPVEPLFFVVTWPVRMLPVGWQPVSLNILAAIWAALTLGLLARSVRLLPHDRTREQRQREGAAFGMLSVRGGFLAPLFAVVMLAGQINFWQNAVAASDDMLDLLVFAIVIYCILEYRIRQDDRWLGWMAFIYGLGVTNNWALIGFFPFFALMLIWIKGSTFFHLRFLGRRVGSGLVGMLLYLLSPLMGSLGGDHGDFGKLLLQELRAQSFGLQYIPHWVVLVAAMPTLLPLIFAGVNWPSFEGEVSPLGNLLTRMMLRLVHVAFLLVALLPFYDFRYSPGLRMREMPIGFLTFYYMGALAIGYFSGYMLLIFGKRPAYGWEKPGPLDKGFCALMVVAVWLLAVAAPFWLYWTDFPKIHARNSDALAQFTDETIGGLPAKETILLSDDPARFFLLEAAYQRRGVPNPNILIETASFSHREYIQYLVRRYPDLKKVMTAPERLRRVLPPGSLVNFLYQVGQREPIYYLHASFGYYFETFYMKPHGVVYELNAFTNAAAQPPLPSAAEISANEAFWARLEKGPLQTLPELADKDGGAQSLAVDYAAALDYWGVNLQRANHLKEAGASFAEAVQLNTNNFVARINLQYNDQLQHGDHTPIDSTGILFRAMMYYRSIVPLLQLNGPMDEPALGLEIGQALAEGRNFRQATALFERRLELLPGDPAALLAVAKTDVDAGDGVRALAVLRGIPKTARINPWELTRVEALAHVANKEYAVAEKMFREGVQANPKDWSRLSILAEFNRVGAYAVRQQGKEEEATALFQNALTNLNLELEVLEAPSAPEAARLELPEALLKKAEVQMMLKSYDGAIATLDECIELRPASPTALLNRAVAEVQVKKMEEAKKDYKALRKLLPNEPYVIDYGLADLAAAEKDSAAEARCLKRYLKSAPDETVEYGRVKQRLQKLEGH